MEELKIKSISKLTKIRCYVELFKTHGELRTRFRDKKTNAIISSTDKIISDNKKIYGASMWDLVGATNEAIMICGDSIHRRDSKSYIELCGYLLDVYDRVGEKLMLVADYNIMYHRED